ncbi:MAG: DUF1294 domain-containing protein [Alphaproteobacteria bacterium]
MPNTDVVLLATAYVVAMNSAGFLAFAWDKHCARKNMWRVPERTLLTLAAVGGTLGIIVAQQTLRHKTRKEPFRSHLRLLVALQIIGLSALSFPQIRSAVATAIIG